VSNTLVGKRIANPDKPRLDSDAVGFDAALVDAFS
jgi:hypothetical protein